jgi:hypothetical protein
MDICQSDGFLTRTTISKSSAWNIPHFYSAIRKLRWGGIVPVLPVSAHEIPQELTKETETPSKHRGTKKSSKNNDDETTKEQEPILVVSPLSRRRPSTYPPVRRDITPPEKIKKNLFDVDEGPQGRYDRNRDARESGIELYQVDKTDSDSDDVVSDDEYTKELDQWNKEDEEDYKEMSEYAKTIKEMMREDKLNKGMESESEGLLDGDEDLGDIPEEDKRIIEDMKEEDWQKWLDALEDKDLEDEPQKKKSILLDDDDDNIKFGNTTLIENKRGKRVVTTDFELNQPKIKGKKGASLNEALLKTPKEKNPSKEKISKVPEKVTKVDPVTMPPKTSGRKKPTPVVRRKAEDESNRVVSG